MSKKNLCTLMSAILAFGAAGCVFQPTVEEKPPVDDGSYVSAPTDSYAATVNSLVATDALNRSFGERDVYDSEKEVGMFYFVWHGAHTSGVFNITELLETNPTALWGLDRDSLAVAPANTMYYWGEPLYGYYSSDDPWVIKRHLELFTMSGIDYIALDLTNLLTYETAIQTIIDEIFRLQALGWNPPKILPMFGENPTSTANIPGFYERMYKSGENDGVWYTDKKSGKPVISMNIKKAVDLPQEIFDYFEFRNTLWPYQHRQDDDEIESFDFSWMDWVYPQHVTPDTGRMSVSVAQHPSYAFSTAVNPDLATTRYNDNWGRGYNYKTGENDETKVESGLNLANQWQTAHDNRDKVQEVFVTGWNEWIATKHLGTDYFVETPNDVGSAVFVDTCNMEFSRDLEMMAGGYGDNFYLQNMSNTRRFKNVEETKYRAGTYSPKLNGAFQKGRTYLDISGEVTERNYQGTVPSLQYTNATNRNDVVSTEMVNDDKYLYIKINTLDDIVFDYGKDNNLNVLLSVAGLSGANWNGYQFVLNRTAAKEGVSVASLEKCSTNGRYAFNKVCDVETYLNGKVFAMKIPLSSLGITNASSFTVDFKVADNISDPSDIMKYYVDGESAPIGRLNYRYHAGK